MEENRRRGREAPEFELVDALRDVFEEGRYFDVFVEYAKAGQEDILCRITAVNRGPEPAPIHVLPHLWYRNTWSWGYDRPRPELRAIGPGRGLHRAPPPGRALVVRGWREGARPRARRCCSPRTRPTPSGCSGHANATPYVKDGIHEAVVHGLLDRVNPEQAAPRSPRTSRPSWHPARRSRCGCAFPTRHTTIPLPTLSRSLQQRIAEADEFYAAIQPPGPE